MYGGKLEDKSDERCGQRVHNLSAAYILLLDDAIESNYLNHDTARTGQADMNIQFIFDACARPIALAEVFKWILSLVIYPSTHICS